MTAAQPAALVTGGAQGIGKGVVRHLAEHGWRVAFLDADADAGRETAAEFAGIGAPLFLHADVADEAQVRAAIGTTTGTFGRLDGLVNNAGIGGPWGVPVEKLELADWNRVLGVNLTAMFLTVKHAAPALRTARGAVVNLSSTRALQSEKNTFAYSASKGGVVALTHALAVSLGPEIRVNCISPGWIECGPWKKAAARTEAHHSAADRDQHPCGRVGTPEDIAELAAFLLSPAAGFITGQNFVADGGMTRKMIYAE